MTTTTTRRSSTHESARLALDSTPPIATPTPRCYLAPTAAKSQQDPGCCAPPGCCVPVPAGLVWSGVGHPCVQGHSWLLQRRWTQRSLIGGAWCMWTCCESRMCPESVRNCTGFLYVICSMVNGRRQQQSDGGMVVSQKTEIVGCRYVTHSRHTTLVHECNPSRCARPGKGFQGKRQGMLRATNGRNLLLAQNQRSQRLGQAQLGQIDGFGRMQIAAVATW